jgi:hypothetical protein
MVSTPASVSPAGVFLQSRKALREGRLKPALSPDQGHWDMPPPPAAPRIVAAVSRDLQDRIRAILPECELRFVYTGSELVRVLDETHCDMMIVEMHFDASTAVAALMCARSRDETFPVVCVRNVPFAKLRWRALRELGAQHFIDLVQYADDAIGNAHVRSMLVQLGVLGARGAPVAFDQARQP